MEAYGFGLNAYLRDPLKIINKFAIAPEQSGFGVKLKLVCDWARSRRTFRRGV